MLSTSLKTNHFSGVDTPLVTVLRALSSQENNDGDEGNSMAAAAEVLTRLHELADQAPELNMSNYDDQQVSELNAAMIEIYLILKAATKKED